METIQPVSASSTKSDQKKSYITDGLILLAVSAVCYLAAYLYELGYATHFGIPKEFVVVDNRGLLLFGAFAVAIGALTFNFANLVTLLHNWTGEHKRSGFALFLQKHIALISLPLLVWIIAGCYVSELFRFFMLNIIWFVTDIVIAIFARMYIADNFGDALRESIGFQKANPAPDLRTRVTTKNQNAIFAGFLALMFFGLSYQAGLGEARRTKTFSITQDNRVLLTRYGDFLFFGLLNADKTKLQPSIQRVPASSEIGILTTALVGPFPEIEPVKITSPVAAAVNTTAATNAAISNTSPSNPTSRP